MPDFAAGSPACPLHAQARIVGGEKRKREKRRIVARVEHFADGGGVRQRLGRQQIAAAKLASIHADRARGFVDQALEQHGRFRTARAAIGAHRCGVGRRGARVELDADLRLRRQAYFPGCK